MVENRWKTEYSQFGTRMAKGHGKTPEEANKDAIRQLHEKGVYFHKRKEAKT
jgi:GTP cyclohydrolase III